MHNECDRGSPTGIQQMTKKIERTPPHAIMCDVATFFQTGPCDYGQLRSGEYRRKFFWGEVRGRDGIGDLMVADSFKPVNSDLVVIGETQNPVIYSFDNRGIVRSIRERD